jgi:large subunit ribosomal protein L17
MRHQRKVKKLQRPAAQRKALLSGLVADLITHKQIKTTLAKAKAVRPFAEKMVTLGKRGDIHSRRLAVAFLRSKSVVTELFDVVAPLAQNRVGGYTRITKLGQRLSDSAPVAFIEWVDQPSGSTTAAATIDDSANADADSPSPAAKKAAKKAAAKKTAKKATKKTAKEAADNTDAPE